MVGVPLVLGLGASANFRSVALVARAAIFATVGVLNAAALVKGSLDAALADAAPRQQPRPQEQRVCTCTLATSRHPLGYRSVAPRSHAAARAASGQGETAK